MLIFEVSFKFDFVRILGHYDAPFLRPGTSARTSPAALATGLPPSRGAPCPSLRPH